MISIICWILCNKEEVMNLRNKIDERYKTSIKSKIVEEINTIRMIRSAIKNKDIENRTDGNKEEINDQQILILLQSLVKQRKDSIESFKIASRDDLIATENKEIEIINQFLPKQVSNEETKKIIEKYLSENNIVSIKDMGKVMNFLKTNYAGTIDMGLAGKIAKEKFEI